MCEINVLNAEEVAGQEAAQIRFLFQGEMCRMEGDVYIPSVPGIKCLACALSPLAPEAWDLAYEMFCGLSQGIEDADLDRLEDCVLEGMQVTKEAYMARLEAACRADVGDEVFDLFATAVERHQVTREILEGCSWGDKFSFWQREEEKAFILVRWWIQEFYLPGVEWKNIVQWERREIALAGAVEAGHKILVLIDKVRACIRVMIEAGDQL